MALATGPQRLRKGILMPVDIYDREAEILARRIGAEIRARDEAERRAAMTPHSPPEVAAFASADERRTFSRAELDAELARTPIGREALARRRVSAPVPNSPVATFSEAGPGFASQAE